MDIDKWTAEKCGIEFIPNREGWYFQNDMPSVDVGAIWWTMQDARCREIVREHFNIDTISGDGDWSCLAECGAQGIGSSIENAEINCIHELIAIMEADNG